MLLKTGLMNLAARSSLRAIDVDSKQSIARPLRTINPRDDIARYLEQVERIAKVRR